MDETSQVGANWGGDGNPTPEQSTVQAKRKYAGVKREAFAKIAILIAQTKETIHAEKMTSVDLARRLGDTLGYYVHESTARKAAAVANVTLVPSAKTPGKIKAMEAEIANLKAKLAAVTTAPADKAEPTRSNRKPVMANSSGVVPNMAQQQAVA